MNHRKLISDTVPINITSYCEPFCDPTDNISGYCPDICFYDCPSSCTTPPPRVTITAVHHSIAQRNLHHSLIITLSFIGLACFLYCLYKLHKIRRRRPLQAPHEEGDQELFLDEDRGPILDHPIWYIRTVGLQPHVIDSITVCKYKKGEGLVEGTDCSVCLSEFEDDETLRLLPKCNHAFHVACIDTWLGSHTNCPLCRAPIVSVPNGTLSPILERSSVEDRVAAAEEREEVERGRNDRDSGSKSATSSMRRSVSMDSLVAPELNKLNMDIVENIVDCNRGLNVSMKRSFSCSGKAFFSGFNREMNSTLPL